MANGKSKGSGLWRYAGPASVAMLAVFCGVIIGLAWRRPALTEEQSGLILSLVDSVSTANGRSAPIRVALFDAKLDNGEATKDLKSILEAESAFTWKAVNSTDIEAGALQEFDVVIFPGGNARLQRAALGDTGKEIVREYVRSGGGYIGICGGAFLATAKYDWGMALVNAKPLTGQIDIPGEGLVSIAARGAGIVKMKLSDSGEKILGNLPGLLDIRYSGGPILSPAGMSDLSDFVSLAEFRTEVWEYEPQRGTMIDTPAIVAGRFGRGRVILFSPHPEMTAGLDSIVLRSIQAVAKSRSSSPAAIP